MNPTAKLSELIECLDFEVETSKRYFDRKTGLVVTVERSVLRALEDGDDDALNELQDWEKGDLENARAILENLSARDRFIDPPNKFDFHDYRQMERFIGTLTDVRAAEQLDRAIRGKGAFRSFKDSLGRLGLREEWFSFRDAKMKEAVLRWARDNDVTVDESR